MVNSCQEVFATGIVEVVEGGGVSHSYSPLAFTGYAYPGATLQGTNPDQTMRKGPGTSQARMRNTRLRPKKTGTRPEE
eukprot:gene16468-biopygen4637